ncbi:MAG TPA: glycosyltransferase family 10 [Planctomycetaceae bacterium]|nr:glycosyltransferase family 10 [Planctomycetaceae bacterium]
MRRSKLQVRLISPWQTYTETETAVFSADIPEKKADALLCEWAPHPELLTFPRRKAWYCCEPQCQFRGLGGGTWPGIKARLGPHEFLWHGHSDEHYRVPHITHFEPLVMNTREDRLDKAIAIVSNHGGSPWRRHPDIAYRNKLITDLRVDLFGRAGWKKYRANWYSRAAAPDNYRGEIPGDWPAGEKRELMSQYKVAVCLENMNEPHYFTEKFVEAVVAGCVPVYRAHPSVRKSVLDGAAWIDIDDFGNNLPAGLTAAFVSDLSQIRHVNNQWLSCSFDLMNSNATRVFDRISKILGSSCHA